MKITSVIILAASLVAYAHGANVIVATTGDGGTVESGSARAIYDLDGNAVLKNTGYIGVGFFNSIPDFVNTAASVIESSFNRLGSSGQMGVDVASGNIADGLFSLNASDAIVAGGTNANFIGENIFVVIGDGSSITNSNGLLVLESSSVFPADPGLPVSIDLQTGASLTLKYGSDSFNGGSGLLINFGGVDYFGAADSYQLAAIAIPEPSSLLLTALGVCGLLVRRRR